ncbi:MULTISPECIES: ArsR/SmtB family transcription factor [Streptomyces]|uniref:ArsR/SmtB family transcription factor n=1 Tax=Streptomyces TaxID=1883 RepID=UPI0006EB2A88|nr:MULTISPECIES: winged helix-turn-helix domain-containing protein [Streptomyces]
MKRIHFTSEDIARTRLGPTIGVAAETLDSLKLLKDRHSRGAFSLWRASLGNRPVGRIGPLAALMPAQGPSFDVASLAGNSASIEEAVETLLAAPRALLRAELENIVLDRAHLPWARLLADGDREALRDVASALRACHDVTVAPYWQRIRSHLATVRSAYAHTLGEGGVEQLFATISGPRLRWRPPVLEMGHPQDEDVHLNGRGLVITPTMFSSSEVALLVAPLDPHGAPVLAVPASGDAGAARALWETGERGGGSLGDLLGRTRAETLEATVGGCSTLELARRLNVSAAAASYHAKVLRNAHLITTTRNGKAVLHSATSLGITLLESHPWNG